MLDDNFITDIKKKANIFNRIFAEKCAPLKNGSVLPIYQTFLTQLRLGALDFNENNKKKLMVMMIYPLE